MGGGNVGDITGLIPAPPVTDLVRPEDASVSRRRKDAAEAHRNERTMALFSPIWKMKSKLEDSKLKIDALLADVTCRLRLIEAIPEEPFGVLPEWPELKVILNTKDELYDDAYPILSTVNTEFRGVLDMKVKIKRMVTNIKKSEDNIKNGTRKRDDNITLADLASFIQLTVQTYNLAKSFFPAYQATAEWFFHSMKDFKVRCTRHHLDQTLKIKRTILDEPNGGAEDCGKLQPMAKRRKIVKGEKK